MKRKIKILASSVSVAAMTFPVLAMAQFSPTSLKSLSGLPSQSVFNIVKAIMQWILMIVGFVGIIGFAIAGILYLTSAGDEDRIKTAKNAMMYSIIGVVVALAGYVALNAANNLLGAKNQF